MYLYYPISNLTKAFLTQSNANTSTVGNFTIEMGQQGEKTIPMPQAPAIRTVLGKRRSKTDRMPVKQMSKKTRPSRKVAVSACS